MGKISSKKLLTNNQINDLTQSYNATLNQLFIYYKDETGNLKLKELHKLFDGILSNWMIERIFFAFGQNNKFSEQDLKYLISLLLEDSLKKELICKLIFQDKSIKKPLFELALLELFARDYDLLSSFILKCDLIEFDNTISAKLDLALKNYSISTTLKSLKYSSNEANNQNDSKLVVNKINSLQQSNSKPNFFFKYECNCNDNTNDANLTRKESINQGTVFIKNLNQMKAKFITYENENNGVFSLNLFESFLIKIKLNQQLISQILCYLKQKIRKNFLQFEEFLWFMDKFNYEESALMISKEDKLSVKDFILFIKSFYKDSTSNLNILVENICSKDKYITYDQFYSLIYSITDCSLFENLEKLKYIPFIFFEVKCQLLQCQKNCVLLMLNNESIDDYILKCIEIGKKYYIINKKFWDDWLELVKWNENENLEPEIKQSKTIEINLNSISDNSGNILPNMVYMKDFILLDNGVYDLLAVNYSIKGTEITRNVILTNSTALESQKLAIKRDDKFLEIELWPISICFMKIDFMSIHLLESQEFKDLNNENSKIEKKQIDSLVKKVLLSKMDKFKSVNYSRNTKFGFLIKKFQDQGFLSKKVQIWIINQGKLYSVDDKKTLEEENSENSIILIFDQYINGKWEKDNFYETCLSKLETSRTNETNNKEDKKTLVGIKNLGNSKILF